MRKKKALAVMALAAVLAGTSVATVPVFAANPVEKATQIARPSDVNYGKLSKADRELLKGMFDAAYYAEENPDVVKALGNDADKLFDHFCRCGIFEGRMANANFNPAAYASAYKDLQKAFGSDVMSFYRHFATYGQNEKRSLTTVAACKKAGIAVYMMNDMTNAGPAAAATPVSSDKAAAVIPVASTGSASSVSGSVGGFFFGFGGGSSSSTPSAPTTPSYKGDTYRDALDAYLEANPAPSIDDFTDRETFDADHAAWAETKADENRGGAITDGEGDDVGKFVYEDVAYETKELAQAAYDDAHPEPVITDYQDTDALDVAMQEWGANMPKPEEYADTAEVLGQMPVKEEYLEKTGFYAAQEEWEASEPKLDDYLANVGKETGGEADENGVKYYASAGAAQEAYNADVATWEEAEPNPDDYLAETDYAEDLAAWEATMNTLLPPSITITNVEGTDVAHLTAAAAEDEGFHLVARDGYMLGEDEKYHQVVDEDTAVSMDQVKSEYASYTKNGDKYYDSESQNDDAEGEEGTDYITVDGHKYTVFVSEDVAEEKVLDTATYDVVVAEDGTKTYFVLAETGAETAAKKVANEGYVEIGGSFYQVVTAENNAKYAQYLADVETWSAREPQAQDYLDDTAFAEDYAAWEAAKPSEDKYQVGYADTGAAAEAWGNDHDDWASDGAEFGVDANGEALTETSVEVAKDEWLGEHTTDIVSGDPLNYGNDMNEWRNTMGGLMTPSEPEVDPIP